MSRLEEDATTPSFVPLAWYEATVCWHDANCATATQSTSSPKDVADILTIAATPMNWYKDELRAVVEMQRGKLS